MILAAQQPNFIPWIGFFHKVARADALVLVDHVQYEHHGVTNRNLLKGPDGAVRLTVPVLTKGRSGQAVAEVEINRTPSWRKKHWRTLLTCYEKAPHFEEHREFFASLYERDWTRLAVLNEEILRYLLDRFGLDRPIHRTSELRPDGTKTQLLISICRRLGATGYLSGTGARKYVDEEQFRQAGLEHRFQSFRHPVYPQLHGPFLPNLSAVDLLFTMGPAAGRIIDASDGDDDGQGAVPARHGQEESCSGGC